MNSVQENKNELEAAVRYCESAISRANATIESMEFRQQAASKAWHEQTGREEALQRELEQKISEVADLKVQLGEREDKWDDAMNENRELRNKIQGQYDDIVMLEREVEVYTKKYNELATGQESETIKSLEYDLTAKTAQAEAWKKKYYDFKESLVKAGDPRVVEGVSGVIMNKPTMPVIPKAVAIAIFREGVAHGVSSACDELDNDAGITIEETGYTGDFEVSFSRWIDLSDHLDLDWMRDKVGDYDEASVIEALKNLCADNKFECRIHGVDDQEEKKND